MKHNHLALWAVIWILVCGGGLDDCRHAYIEYRLLKLEHETAAMKEGR